MKKLLLSLFITAISIITVNAQATFKTTKHNFGKIKHNVPATYTFTFTNTGSTPLVIESAVAGCGCTTPEYPKNPIAKGKTGTIKVTYNAATVGAFTKDVTVKFLKQTEPVVLNISGEVLDENQAQQPVQKDKSKKPVK
jgi:hypothetical protein